MHPEIDEKRRRQYLQLLDINIYPYQSEPEPTPAARKSSIAAETNATRNAYQAGNDASGASSARTTTTSAPAASAQPPTAVSQSSTSSKDSSYSHDCLLLCDTDARELPLLLDILRHVPALAAADDEFLHSHIVTARQLAALTPRLLLATCKPDQVAASRPAKMLSIDLQQLHSDPVGGKIKLWKKLQTLLADDVTDD